MASTNDRGYGWQHQQLRAAIAPEVDAGRATCWRCRQPILRGQPWDLGHDDEDRTKYRGPEHRHRTKHCIGNRAAGTIKGNRGRSRGLSSRPSTASRW